MRSGILPSWVTGAAMVTRSSWSHAQVFSGPATTSMPARSISRASYARSIAELRSRRALR